ncbi:hypothetical protein LCGC14_1491850 [marine sediment metagenome]|uniref:Uncharacterized protein n=1 Tax=marine sediment metagenome TaxID=412755 RepID=A0A0F9LM33_9ZZZZ
MTDAITLDPKEMETAKQQCERCFYWNWYYGCGVPIHKIDNLPVGNCKQFKPTVAGLRSV